MTVDVTPGGSGYFSTPSTSLDPHLFSGTELRPAVRRTLLDTFYTFFSERFKEPEAWTTLWLAGSGISYQWDADRGNGDLDVLVGVPFDHFFTLNPEYHGIPEGDMADIFNHWLKTELWPKTARTDFNGQTYEVTYYVNPGGADIRNIHPYAAYDVTHDSWTIKPPKLPQDPTTLYDKSWWDQVDRETNAAKSIVSLYNTTTAALSNSRPGSAEYARHESHLDLLGEQAHQMFDDIHLGRKEAFAPGGGGYGDWANFRWQAHKRAGTVQALSRIARPRNVSVDQYGRPIKDAHAALTEAAMWGKHLRGMP